MAKDMLGTLVRRIADLPLEMLGALCDLTEKMLGEAGQEWLTELKKFLRKENCWTSIITETILKLLSGGENLAISATNGTEILAKANDVFNYIDSDFVNWGADEPGPATPETTINVYEMSNDSTFAQMFGSLSKDLDKLCLTQAQIKSFVKDHRKWLRLDGYATFFLFKSRNQFFVARVHVASSGELRVSVLRFGRSIVWYAEDRSRVVVPQLA